MALAPLSEANPNGLFRWVPLLRSSGNRKLHGPKKRGVIEAVSPLDVVPSLPVLV